MRWWLLLLLSAVMAVGLVYHFARQRGPSSGSVVSLDEIRLEIIPAAGTPTAYGKPLSLQNAQTFADWFDEIKLNPEEAALLKRAIGGIPTPCCDDTRLTRCCCEEGGLICNLVRSARGLAAWLVRQGFQEEEVRAAVEEWLRFAHPNYYLARALKDAGIAPEAHGLTTKGSCYRGLCDLPLSLDGCGGMGAKVKL